MRPVGTVRSVRTAVQAVIIVLVCCCLLTLNSGVRAPAAAPTLLLRTAKQAAAIRKGFMISAATGFKHNRMLVTAATAHPHSSSSSASSSTTGLYRVLRPRWQRWLTMGAALVAATAGVAPWSAARPSALHNSAAAAAAAAASQRRGMSSSAVVSGRGVSTVQGTDLLVVYVTAPNADVAEKIANKLVEQQLVACVNVLPGITSIYRWQGKVEKDSEVLMILKTQGALLDKLTAKVRELHPYDEPEVIGLPIIGGSPSYMQWVVDNTSP